MKHVHAEVIKAWADGIEIQRCGFMTDNEWRDLEDGEYPDFRGSEKWRVKPEPPAKVYPVTRMTDLELCELWNSIPSGGTAAKIAFIANAALRHAIDAGQVVPFQEFKAAGDSWGECIRNRKSRDLAIAEAVLSACQNARFTIPGFDGIDLATIIATVKD